MKMLAALVLLAQLLICKATSPPFFPHLHTRHPDCDDPEVEDAAAVAVHYINSHNLHGYKVVLNRIKDIKVLPRRPHGEIFKLELEVLETTCHVVDPLPVENCTVRERMAHAVEGDCDVKLLKHDDVFIVLARNCHSSPDSAEDLHNLCPDCPQLMRLNDKEVVHAVKEALNHFNGEATTPRHYKLLEISRGLYSHMPIGVHVEFAIVGTNCSAQDAKDHLENCHVEIGGNHTHFGFCKASVMDKTGFVEQGGVTDQVGDQPVAQDKAHHHAVEVNCDLFDQKPGISHTHLAVHHLGGNRPSPGRGFKVLDLIHSHNDTHASHESHSQEVKVVQQASSVTKRDVAAEHHVAPPPPPSPPPQGLVPILPVLPRCPGKIRHFKI